jgi:hypothetical protein
VVCVAIGVGLRGHAYLRNPSLWIDEAMLALNVVHRTTPELLQPLDLNQGAPVGYLFLSKLTVKLLGTGELALRLPSFVAGVAGLFLFVALAYRALPLAAARLAVVLFALSPFLIGYSAEFKQYELDATIAVALVTVGLPVWRNEAGQGRAVGLALAGAASVWFSHPAAFVLGGVGLAILADAAARRDRAALAARTAVVACWAASFAACYWFVLRKLGLNPYLLDYWSGKFLPLPPTRPGDFAWVVHHILEFFERPGGFAAAGFGAGGLAAACCFVGALALAKADWRLLVALATPLGLALLASGLQKYPFAGRLLLFAVPAALLLVAYGAALIAGRVGSSVRGAGLVVVGVLVVPLLAQCWALVKQPLHAEDAREVVAHVRANWRDGDRLYVTAGAAPAFAYYQRDGAFPADAVRTGRDYRADLEPLRGSRRVWVVVAHRSPAELAALRAHLDMMGRCDEAVRGADAEALRYDLCPHRRTGRE